MKYHKDKFTRLKVITLVISCILFSCNKTLFNDKAMEDYAIEVGCHMLIEDFDWIETQNRASDRDYSQLCTGNLSGHDEIVGKIIPYASIIESHDYRENIIFYYVKIDEEGQEIIAEWAGDEMRDCFRRYLNFEWGVYVQVKDGEFYLPYL